MNEEQSYPKEEENGTGFLVIRAYTANNAIPLEGVKIKISIPETNSIIYNLITDRSGKTDTVSISVPTKEMSSFPGNQKKFGTVNIEAALQGYRTQTYSNVPIFDTVIATQNIAMIPLSDSERNYIFDYKENMLFTTEENSL